MIDSATGSDACREFLEQSVSRIEKLARSELWKKGCIDPAGHSGEVLGDVSVKILKKWNTLRSPDDALNSTVINTARTHAYKCRREVPQEMEDDVTPCFILGAVDPREMAAMAIYVDELLSGLAETDQQIISLCFQGFTFEEIAEIKGMLSSTIRSRYARALRKLRQIDRPLEEPLVGQITAE